MNNIDLKQCGEELTELFRHYTPEGLLAGEHTVHRGDYKSQSYRISELLIANEHSAIMKDPFAELYHMEGTEPILTMHTGIFNDVLQDILTGFKKKTGLELRVWSEITPRSPESRTFNVSSRYIN